MTALEKQYHNQLKQQKDALERYLQRQTLSSPGDGIGGPDEQMLVDWMRTRLKSITAALERFTDDEFGLCMACNCRINPERLEALPDAVFCIRCQETRHPPFGWRRGTTIPEGAYQGGTTCMMAC